MPNSREYPFQRVAVDHLILGSSRVWWQMHPRFRDPLPHTFQLQYGRTGDNSAADWVNVGDSALNVYYAVDDAQRDYGKLLLTHYRVVVSTPIRTYVSQPVSCQGELTEQDLILAREYIRKEKLRHRKVSRAGYVLKRRRYGAACTRCLDPLTGEIADSDCKVCNGTGFQVGYYAPVPLQAFDLSPETIAENQDPQGRLTTRDTVVTARVLGFPMLSKLDVWVDPKSDQRWVVDAVKHTAVVRGMPIVMEVTMRLAPFTDGVYRIEVGGEPAARDGPYLPGNGAGCVVVDHDYGGTDELAYTAGDGTPIAGATIKAFLSEDYDAALPGLPADSQIRATSSTMANGRWSFALNLDPGDYVLVFEKTGQYGPDIARLTVRDPALASSDSSSSDSSDSFWCG
jgi:hypothetical protein